MLRFIANFFLHPGTWVAGGVILVGCCIAFPPVAPILAPIAVGSFAVSVPTFIPYIRYCGPGSRHKSALAAIEHFSPKHPFQATVLVLTLLAFIAALVLTIGFLTGGAGFTFMAPLLAVGAGSLFGPALLGFATVIAPLTIGNNLKRFLGWLDSFTRDGGAVCAINEIPAEGVRPSAEDWKKNRAKYTEQQIQSSPVAYLKLFGQGVKATILPSHDKGYFTSPDAELIEKCKVKHD